MVILQHVTAWSYNLKLLRLSPILFQNKILTFITLSANSGDDKLMIFILFSQKLFHVNCVFTLRKHAYSNILTFLPSKNENFQTKNSDIFHISAKNIDCGYSLEPPQRGGSNEYPQSMFLSRNKKNNVYPCKPQFYCIKVGFKGVKII